MFTVRQALLEDLTQVRDIGIRTTAPTSVSCGATRTSWRPFWRRIFPSPRWNGRRAIPTYAGCWPMRMTPSSAMRG